MKKCLLATSAFSNPDLLEKCIKSWPKSDSVDHLVFIDKDTGIFDSVLTETITTLRSIDHNGVSAAWNKILEYAFSNGYELVVVVGSDTTMEPGFLENYVKEFEDKNLQFAVANEYSWNCWAMSKECYETVGSFDPNMFVYYSDNDYHHRVHLSGINWAFIGNQSLFWHYGSATIRKSESYNSANSITFGMDGKYFSEKWGGYPANETFQLPFNNHELTIKDWTLDVEAYENKKSIWNKK